VNSSEPNHLMFKKFYYENVPGIGNVAVSRHAQERAQSEGITEHDFAQTLEKGRTVPDGQAAIWRELNGVRIVIVLRPEPFRGATLATTVFRVQRQA
jgi:hypothetical protein